jgi:hypothetical protein
MFFTRSDRSPVRRLIAGTGLVVAAGCAAAFVPATPLAAQQAEAVVEAVSSEFSISRETALLKLELADGRTVEAAIRDGAAFVDGRRIGDAPRGGPLDRAWRELLNEGMDVSSAQLSALLAAWTAPGAVGTQMAEALRAAVTAPVAAAGTGIGIVAPAASTSDTVQRLMERIIQLERTQQQAEREAARAARADRAERAAPERGRRFGTLHYIGQGLSGIFSLIITYAVLFAIAFVTILFGGRRYIEGVGDTARHATGRSMLVGLAAGFLVVPAFILGIIALVISIVGIPGLLVWIPGFPVAVALALMLGYLGIAHAGGEALAERRFYVTDWFERGNSYYFLLSGLGLLLAFFLAAQVVHMAGPWLQVIRGILVFLGFVTTFFACCTGLGAVLLSRAGTRPIRRDGLVDDPADMYTEEAGV